MQNLVAEKIETPLGILDLTIENFYMSGRINEVVIINRVHYGIEIVVRFIAHLEDWQIISQVYRAIPAGIGLYKAYEKNGQPYARTPNNDMATPAAQKHINGLLRPCLTQWIDQNARMIIQAQHTTEMRTAERALEIVKSFKGRVDRTMQQMDTIEAKTKRRESLTDQEKKVLEEVLSHRYWMW